MAAVEVKSAFDRYYSVTLVGIIGKSERLLVPMVFLQAILDDDLVRFVVLARSGGRAPGKYPEPSPFSFPAIFSPGSQTSVEA